MHRGSFVCLVAAVAAQVLVACNGAAARSDDVAGTDVGVNSDVVGDPRPVDNDADRASDAVTDPSANDVPDTESDGVELLDVLDAPEVPEVGHDIERGDVHSPGYHEVRLFAPYAESVEVVASFAGWDVPGLTLERDAEGWWRRDVSAVEGDAWRFVVRRMGVERWLADPGAFELTEPYEDAVLRMDTRTGTAVVDQRRLVLYEAHVGTFRSPYSPERSGFEGLRAGVEWLGELGVSGIALMPVQEFNSERSWGYNPVWPFAVERDYGGFDGLVDFTRTAHEEGIAVIGDFVLNHLDAGSLLCRVDTEPDEVCGGGWIAPIDARETPWGPRPAFAPASLRGWWAERLVDYVRVLGFDGLRFDATVWVRTIDGRVDAPWSDGEAMLREATDALRIARPDGVWIAEDLQGDGRITTPVDAGGFGFDLQWDARWHGVIREILLAEPGARDIDRVFDVVAADPRRVLYLESHDTTGRLNAYFRAPHNVRLPDDLAFAHDADRAARALSLGTIWLFTSPGTPMMLQGQEWWQHGSFHDDAPIDASLAAERVALVDWHRDLIAARRGACGGCKGLTTEYVRRVHRHREVGVVAWVRGVENPVLVVSNVGATDFAEYRVGAPAAGRWRVESHSLEPLGGSLGVDSLRTDELPWDGEPVSLSIPLPAGVAVVLVRDE